MCKDPQFFGTIGIAWVGTLCRPNNWKGYKTSLNEKRESAISSAEVSNLKYLPYAADTELMLLLHFEGCCS